MGLELDPKITYMLTQHGSTGHRKRLMRKAYGRQRDSVGEDIHMETTGNRGSVGGSASSI